MKNLASILALALVSSLAVSCYHARIETGLSPSATVVDKSFAACWIYGLVPPSTVKAAQECPNGVAVVETELSFVNGLVGALTLGIYTPMHVKVTCAASSAMGRPDHTPNEDLAISTEASADEVVEIFDLAAKHAATNRQPVYVHFEAPSMSHTD